MIEKIVCKRWLQEDEIRANLKFWLSRAPEERIEAVELLRRRYYGDTARLQRTVRIVQRSSG